MLEIRDLGRRGLAVALLAVGLASVAEADPKADAQTAMKSTIDAVLGVLRTPGLDEPAKRKKIEAIAKERFDFTTMSKLVLKRDWRTFSKPEQDEFVKEFTNYLAASYGTRIARYGKEDVATTGSRAEANGDVTVQTRIVGGEFDGSTVDYRMKLLTGEWQVIDVVIEGISLVSNFRSQFADVIAQGGAKELLARLKEKNASGVVDVPPTSKPAKPTGG
jgi:phospholipid transport system substrate-binding protein